jgi:hypothetical protein
MIDLVNDIPCRAGVLVEEGGSGRLDTIPNFISKKIATLA